MEASYRHERRRCIARDSVVKRGAIERHESDNVRERCASPGKHEPSQLRSTLLFRHRICSIRR